MMYFHRYKMFIDVVADIRDKWSLLSMCGTNIIKVFKFMGMQNIRETTYF